ncbi:hypothetical protein AX774_g7169, partial [Zancudomyces culisetae]
MSQEQDINATLQFLVESVNTLMLNQQAMAAKVTERAENSTAPPAEVPPEVPPVMASTSRAPLGPHLAIRSEPVELRTYHELVAFVPSIGENFYKTAYTGKERAEVYQKFYKNTDMNYKPPKI